MNPQEVGAARATPLLVHWMALQPSSRVLQEVVSRSSVMLTIRNRRKPFQDLDPLSPSEFVIDIVQVINKTSQGLLQGEQDLFTATKRSHVLLTEYRKLLQQFSCRLYRDLYILAGLREELLALSIDQTTQMPHLSLFGLYGVQIHVYLVFFSKE